MEVSNQFNLLSCTVVRLSFRVPNSFMTANKLLASIWRFCV